MTTKQLRQALDDAEAGAGSWAVTIDPEAIWYVRCGGEDRTACKVTVEFTHGRWSPVIHAAPLGYGDTP